MCLSHCKHLSWGLRFLQTGVIEDSEPVECLEWGNLSQVVITFTFVGGDETIWNGNQGLEASLDTGKGVQTGWEVKQLHVSRCYRGTREGAAVGISRKFLALCDFHLHLPWVSIKSVSWLVVIPQKTLQGEELGQKLLYIFLIHHKWCLSFATLSQWWLLKCSVCCGIFASEISGRSIFLPLMTRIDL